MSELKARSWVNSLVAGKKDGCKGFAFFFVSCELTEEGLDHTDEIVSLIFQYINMLKEVGPQQWVFEECRDLSAMSFRFKEKGGSISFASNMSPRLLEYPIDDALTGKM